MNTRLFAADIDRTLLRSPTGDSRIDQMPTNRILRVRRALRDAGVGFAVITTRSEALIGGRAVQALEPDAYILDGGATRIGPAKQDSTRQTERHWLKADRVIRIANAIGPSCLELYCTAEYRKRTPDNLALDEITEEAPSVFAVFEQPAVTDDKIRELLAGESDLAMHFNSNDGSESVRCVQITDTQGTKEAGLHWLVGQYGINLDQVAAIGDGPGDRGFIAMSGQPFAMGNSDPSLFTIPKVTIVPSVESDGAAVAMQHTLAGIR